MTATLELAQQLIARRSVTPADEGCQALIAERLRPIGFGNETISANGVTNEARTPTVVKGIGPASFKHRQSRSHRTPSGTMD